MGQCWDSFLLFPTDNLSRNREFGQCSHFESIRMGHRAPTDEENGREQGIVVIYSQDHISVDSWKWLLASWCLLWLCSVCPLEAGSEFYLCSASLSSFSIRFSTVLSPNYSRQSLLVINNEKLSSNLSITLLRTLDHWMLGNHKPVIATTVAAQVLDIPRFCRARNLLSVQDHWQLGWPTCHWTVQ